MYRVTYSSRFKKDLKKVLGSGRFNEKRLTGVLEMLASEKTLPGNFKDHPLRGNLNGCRECHLLPDLLLIYQKIDDLMMIYALRIGSHSELF